MARRFLTTIAVLSTLLSSASVLGEEKIEGQGKYRPLTVIRQLKLATSLFVNPNLINKAKISNAYGWDEAVRLLGSEDLLLQGLNSGKLQLSLPVKSETSDGQRTLTLLAQPATENLELDRLKKEAYVLSADDLDLDTEDRVIAWEPDENVEISWGDPQSQ